jgi:Tfp pilus assembly protein PilN
MSQVNLLPPEILQGLRTRRLTFLVFVAGSAVAVLIVLFYAIQVGRLVGVQDDIEAARANNASIQAEIAELQRYEDLQIKAQEKEALLASAYANEASFSGMLMDISRVIPVDAYLDSLTITIAPPIADTTGAEVATGSFIGSIATSGVAQGFDSLSMWISDMEKVDGWVNPWLSSITQQGENTDLYSFTSTVDLTDAVLTERGKAAAVAGG